MTWYYYSGPKVEPIPVGNGEVKAIPPFTHFEVHGDSGNATKLGILRARGFLRVCGMPASARGSQPASVKVESVPIPSRVDDRFSESIVSEGPVKVAGEASSDSGISGNPDDDVKRRASRASRSRKRRIKPERTQET